MRRPVVEFKILGPLVVQADDGAPIEVARVSQRQTLMVFLLKAARPCPGALLIEAMWPESQMPGDPADALRTRILALRRQVPGGHQRLETHPYGYQLTIRPGELDADRFRALAADGRTALDGGDAGEAARLLQEAVDLWREPTWQDLPPTPSMTAAAARLDEQRQEAQDALAEARLALGQHRAIVAQLRGRVTAEPLREHTWALLMIALYRCGQKSQALDAYGRVRAVTVTEYGQDPSPELERVRQQILDDDPALGWDAPAAAAPPGAVLAGAAQPPRYPVCQLPAEPTDFTGRAAESAAMARRLAGRAATAVTVITGLAGAGKTSLALHAAHQARPQFGDGQLFADLGGSRNPRDPQDVLAEMLRALGVPPGGIPVPAAERAAMYRSLLAGSQVLVVLDDATAAAQIRPLLPGTAGAAVIVTSRSRLPDLDSAIRVEVGQLSPGEAVALLSKVSGRQLAGGDAAAAAGVVTACECLPLAVRAAGARLAARPQMPAAALAHSLADAGRILSELAIGDLSVRRSIAASYGALDGRSRRAWRLLAAHGPEEMPPWLPAALLGETYTDRAGIAEQLASAGMLVEIGHASGARYRMPALWRAYGRDQLEPGDLTLAGPALKFLHTAWLELADAADQHLPRLPNVPDPPRLTCSIAPAAAASTAAEATAWFDAERPNLLAAARRVLEEGQTELAADIASRMLAYQCQRGQQDEAEKLWLAVVYGTPGSGALAARARYRLAVLDVSQGRPAAAMRRLGYCMDAFELCGDRRALADAQCLAATAAAANWDLRAALGYAGKSLANAREEGDTRLISLSLAVYGAVTASLGRGTEGIRCCEEALAIAATLNESCWALVFQALKHARYSAGREPAAGWQARGPGLFPAGLSQSSSGAGPAPGTAPWLEAG